MADVLKTEEERTWTWLMPGGETSKVVANPKDGTIKFYDADGKLMRKYENLEEEAVCIIERTILKRERYKYWEME